MDYFFFKAQILSNGEFQFFLTYSTDLFFISLKTMCGGTVYKHPLVGGTVYRHPLVGMEDGQRITGRLTSFDCRFRRQLRLSGSQSKHFLPYTLWALLTDFLI